MPKPLSLKNADSSTKKDKSIVLEAVHENGFNLMFASPTLQDNKEIAAVKENGQALSYPIF